uniref:Uncharacterized protein n=1 Tax=Avena sativa TaxID=4498 RepID=A0ACD5UJC2_AVESA
METPAALAGGALATATEAPSASQPGATTTSSSSSTPPAPAPAPAARKRTPGRWKRIPRVLSTDMQARMLLGGLDFEDRSRRLLKNAEELEAIDPNGCDSEEAKIAFIAFQAEEAARYRRIARTRPQDLVLRPIVLSDTKEELLTAEEMEARFAERKGCHVAQLKHLAQLSLDHYNTRKAEHNKFELAQALTSNCFTEDCGTTYAHVNFTATSRSNQNDQPMKRLFFAELMLVPELRLCEDVEPMRVLQVSTIDDAPCFGGCHQIRRRIDHGTRGVMDYERCHACDNILKHPKGDSFIGGHNSTRRPYYSAT